MSDPFDPRSIAVPAGRLARLSRLGGLATGLAGRAAWDGARHWAAGRRPDRRELLLTPANAARFADELSRMRGAAMKVGQLLSMESGEVLPPELADILARLRAEAHHMPPRQLKSVLAAAWGPDFLRRFQRFEVRPVAAASIGQVHRAQTRDGRDLAVKVQYPGVRASIDADVDNVGALVRWSGLAPEGLELAPLLAEAKRQLHDEADYLRERDQMARFGALLAGDPDFRVPAPQDDLTTRDVLAMEWMEGSPVEALAEADQPVRDSVAGLLVALTLRELFEFGRMQTDPNFANYRVEEGGARVILLDFGAAQEIPAATAAGFRRLLGAALGGTAADMEAAAQSAGFLPEELPEHQRRQLRAMMEMATAPLRQQGAFDFAAADLPARMRAAGEELGASGDFTHVPPFAALYVMRKVSGMYLLAARLRARAPLRALVAPYAG